MRPEINLSIRIILLAAVSFCVISCGVTETTKSRSLSPGGLYAATLTVSDCGAICSPSASVTLHDPHNRIGDGDIKVFDGIGGWPIELHWIGPRTMVVVFCEGRRIKVRSDIAEARVPDPRDPYATVKVIVINDKAMVVGGKSYCLFPEPKTERARSSASF